MSIQLKSKDEISIMREANMLVYEVLQSLKEMVKPGVSTAELDRRAIEMTRARGAEPAFLGYPSATAGVEAFPGTICASRNSEIVHGIPNDEPLKEGDIVSIDYGCRLNGFFGDSAVTLAVGKISEDAEKLLRTTESSLEEAIANCKVGNRIGDISSAVQTLVEESGFGVVREFVGHGIGRNMHEAPHVPNFGTAGKGRQLKPGLVIAIEPMVTQGAYQTELLADGWTAVTKDGSLAAHFEHTVAITEDGPLVLSRP